MRSLAGRTRLLKREGKIPATADSYGGSEKGKARSIAAPRVSGIVGERSATARFGVVRPGLVTRRHNKPPATSEREKSRPRSLS
jgi:hypothetical protein